MTLADIDGRARPILIETHKYGGVRIFDGTRRGPIGRLAGAGYVSYGEVRRKAKGKVRRCYLTVVMTPEGDALCRMQGP